MASPEALEYLSSLLGGEAGIRLGFFFGVFVAMGVLEIIAPRRKLTTPKGERWFANLTITFANVALSRLLLPILPVGLAVLCKERGWGLLNNVALPTWVDVAIGVVVLDCAIYLQHVMFHAVPLLWRLHRMHHADLDFDVTTGLRFHQLEIMLSMGIKLGVVAALGPPAVAVVTFEVLLNATSMFNHGNLRLPLALDRVLRLVVVTPDMHRVHHSVVIREANNNFGFNLPWWDRLFGTYRPQPEAGHEGMTIGLGRYRDPKRLTLPWLLAMPFTGRPAGHPINRP
ncbi:MAG: sterol desaturase family protein [Planctomycetota bacterium]|jgi:sterol desaturase/sphingolipid hydroxylase (fatty acid hydroxylase superfamily)